MKIVLAVSIFFLIFIAFELVYSLLRKSDAREVYKAVERYATPRQKSDEISLMYHRKFSDMRLLNKLLSAIPAVGRLDELMQQGGVKILAGVFILLSLTAGALSFLFCTFLLQPLPISILVACIGTLLPFLYLFYKRSERKAKFEALFPDALDLMSYSLKAGHSIMASFKMVSEEIANPVREEFDRVVDEINFGKDLDSTLRNFSRRIDSPELKFFVTSVIIQRETGGNLVELLGRISSIIRKKFRFREKVKALSGEGKLSAIILVVLPFVVAGFISMTNPSYVRILLEDPIGHYLMGLGLLLMSFGSFIMYRLVQLDM